MNIKKMDFKWQWFRFMDMHTGTFAECKTPYEMIYIEALSQGMAEDVFEEQFGLDPHRGSWSHEGDDFSIMEGDTLEEITSYHRRRVTVVMEVCSTHAADVTVDSTPIEQYLERQDICVIHAIDYLNHAMVGSDAWRNPWGSLGGIMPPGKPTPVDVPE